MVAISLNSYSQTYIKVSPTLFIPKHSDASPGVLGAVGIQLNRYAKAGVSGGYLKMQGMDKGVGLIGLDLNVCDYSKRKVLPTIHTSVYYPIYNSASEGLISYESTGTFHIQFSGGISIPIAKRQSVFVTGGISQLMYNTTFKTAPGTKERTVINMFIISAGLFL